MLEDALLLAIVQVAPWRTTVVTGIAGTEFIDELQSKHFPDDFEIKN